MMNNILPISVKGHVYIEDDLGNILLDKDNAIHPQNMARVIARALAHEPNSWIGRIAFGNGGTVVDAAYQITYHTPNDGLPPDIAAWRSQLYNETYTEYVDESQVTVSTGPGSNPSGDPVATNNNPSGPGVVSNELGLISQVVVTCILNANEPSTQYLSDIVGNPLLNLTEYTESPFTFDEIGLFTTGAPQSATSGYQLADIGTRVASDITGLGNDTVYVFDIEVDGITQNLTISTPLVGSGPSGQILYSDLVTAINSVLTGATVSINGTTATTQTYGFLKFVSNSTGNASSISLVLPVAPAGNWLFDNLSSFVGFSTATAGIDSGVDNDVNHPTHEAERLLAHICFSPLIKTSNRVFSIKYTLTVSVARSS